MDNSIGEEGTTNNKFDEMSIMNDKIVEERASRISNSVDEYAVEKMRQRGLQCQEGCTESQSGECTESASVQTVSPDAESVEYKNLSFMV